MARYVATIPSLMAPAAAFLYMADLRNFAKWDKGVNERFEARARRPNRQIASVNT